MLSTCHHSRARLATAMLLVILCAACTTPLSRQGTKPPSTSFPSRTAPSLPHTPSLMPTPGRVQSPGTDWKTYTDSALGITFSYPPTWQEKSPGSYASGGNGATGGGYVWSELRENDGAGTGAVCQGEANREKPHRYGAYPEIQDTLLNSAPACLILPSPDQPPERQGEALYLLWLPDAIRPNTLWVLHADANHILAIVKSLRLSQQIVATATAHCDTPSQPSDAITYHQGGLRIQEFPIAPATACTPGQDPEGFNQVVSTGAPAAAAASVVNGQFAASRLSKINQRLAPFGFQVQVYNQTLFRVLQNGKVLRSNIFWIGQLTVNTSGSDFILPIVDSYNSLTMIVRPDGVHPIENWDLLLFDNIFPVFVGDNQISLEYDYQRYPRQTNNPALLQVKRDGQIIDTLSINGATPSRGPVRGLWSWDGHWVLELPGLVIQDGQSLNDQLGYSEMFTWRLLQDKPFYFFRQNGQIHVSYNHQTLPIRYDEVIHDPQWNTAMLLELKAYDSGLLFYARRGDIWYYVVIQVDPSST